MQMCNLEAILIPLPRKSIGREEVRLQISPVSLPEDGLFVASHLNNSKDFQLVSRSLVFIHRNHGSLTCPELFSLLLYILHLFLTYMSGIISHELPPRTPWFSQIFLLNILWIDITICFLWPTCSCPARKAFLTPSWMNLVRISPSSWNLFWIFTS